MSQREADRERREQVRREVEQSFLWSRVCEWVERQREAALSELLQAETLIDVGEARGKVKAYQRISEAPKEILDEWQFEEEKES